MANNNTFAESLINALSEVAKVNRSVQVKPAAVLWPDKDGTWRHAIPTLQKLIPNLYILGPYEPERGSGPAIWLKCAVAGSLQETLSQGIPVVYLPGVSRTELRAIEDCSRDLQPLAELQYRGVIWSQANMKDWTLSAFLSSKNGGLGLDVAQDKVTQEALGQVLEAGELLECSLAEFKGKQINAEWLHSLLAPNPVRDLLVWLNDPKNAQNQWKGVRWEVFVKRCKSDFSLDPLSDGVLTAAELLAKANGKWAAVTELYKDSYTSFPNVFELLAKVQPPQMGLFPDLGQLSGYPQANEQSESSLRNALFACATMDALEARAAIIAAESEHGIRRNWLWNRMGRSPLAAALAHLVRAAELSKTAPVGQTPAELATSYQQSGWQVDEAALYALAAVSSKVDVEAVSAAVRAVYLPWAEEAAQRLQNLIKTTGGLTSLSMGMDKKHGPGTCTVFVDGLRYDVAVRLRQRLSGLGKTSLSANWTSLPSVTASGKGWCSPVADHLVGTTDDVEFEPRVAADGRPLSSHNFRKLLAEHGVQPLGKHESGDVLGRAWTEAGDLDHYGHEHGIRLARDLEAQLDQVVERIDELCEAGWKRLRIVTDHGWLLIPGGLPKTELAKHQTETRWGRCAVLKETAHGTPLTFGWDWCKDVQVAYAPGVSSFKAGDEYAHGGISLQECLVPMLELEVTGAQKTAQGAAIKSATWKGLRCVVEVDSASQGLKVDIRTKPTQSSSSLVATPKSVEDGKASLAIVDDDCMGSAAVIVILSSAGDVLQKQATTVGEQ